MNTIEKYSEQTREQLHGGVKNSIIGKKNGCIVFCHKCGTRFFDGDVQTAEQILGYFASLQVAFSHESSLHHPIEEVACDPLL